MPTGTGAVALTRSLRGVHRHARYAGAHRAVRVLVEEDLADSVGLVRRATTPTERSALPQRPCLVPSEVCIGRPSRPAQARCVR